MAQHAVRGNSPADPRPADPPLPRLRVAGKRGRPVPVVDPSGRLWPSIQSCAEAHRMWPSEVKARIARGRGFRRASPAEIAAAAAAEAQATGPAK